MKSLYRIPSATGSALLSALVLCVYSPLGNAQNQKKSACQNAYEELDYEAVPKNCASVASDEKKDVKERANAALYMAVAQTALGKKKKGKAWFIKLLALDPGRTLGPEISPDIRKVFDAAKIEFQKESEITLSHTAPETTPTSEIPVLNFILDDPMDLAAKMELDVWASGDTYKSDKKTVEFAKTREGSSTFFEGALLDPALGDEGVPLQYVIEYQARFLTAQGDPLPLQNPMSKTQINRQRTEAVEDESSSIAWIVAGGVTALVVGVGAVVGVRALCYQGVGCSDDGETRAVAGVEAGIAQ